MKGRGGKLECWTDMVDKLARFIVRIKGSFSSPYLWWKESALLVNHSGCRMILGTMTFRSQRSLITTKWSGRLMAVNRL